MPIRRALAISFIVDVLTFAGIPIKDLHCFETLYSKREVFDCKGLSSLRFLYLCTR